MKRYFRISKAFMRMTLSSQMAYRLNFLSYPIAAFFYTILYLFAFKFTFDKVSPIGGYTFKEIMLFVILTQTWYAFYIMFVRLNFKIITDYINNGMLDMWLLKPVKFSSYLYTFRINFTQALFITGMLSFLFYNIFKEGISFLNLIGFIYFFINSVWMMHSFLLMFISMTFWVGRNKSIFEIDGELPFFVQIPMSLYPSILKFTFIFGIPIIPLLNPSFHLAFSESFETWILPVSFLMGPFFHILSRIFWKSGLKNYSSAN